jgi:hypothetical protein
MGAPPRLPSTSRKVPLAVKLAYTAFMAVLVPSYWINYGPTNFLYFCDVALFLTLASLWTEQPLWAGMAAVGILVPQMLWVVDFLCGLVGFHPVGMTEYMFNTKNPLFNRSLSLFHGWLPFFLVWLVYRLGYDRRSLPGWTVLAWVLMLICYLWMPPPPADPNSNKPVNINYVFGLSDKEAQQWMPAPAWLAAMMVGLPVAFYVPAHFFLCWLPTWKGKQTCLSPALETPA